MPATRESPHASGRRSPGTAVTPARAGRQRAAGATGLLALQRIAGNRAVGRLLARQPYDEKLSDSESVIQPPVSWLKYPPATRTRLQVFDAIVLIDRWWDKHDNSPYRTEMRELRKRMYSLAHQITTPAQYMTYRKFAKLRPEELKDRYAQAVRTIAQDRASWRYDLHVLDEIVEDRIPGVAWHAEASAELKAVLAEQDWRKQRQATLTREQHASFDKFEKLAAAWPNEGHQLWSELVWMWIHLRDLGQSPAQAEAATFKELTAMYESVLRELDAAIQKDCTLHAPHTTRERIANNLYKAWGDPCKPWFEPFGHGENGLAQFQRLLRISRDDDPFARAYYWTTEYRRAYRSQTDPQAALDELRAQALVGTIANIGMPIAAAGKFFGEVRIPFFGSRAGGSFFSRFGSSFVGRRAGAFLRSAVMGVHLSTGEIGGSGAEVGKFGELGNRPRIVAVLPSEPVIVTPRSEMPDLPEPARPSVYESPVKPAAPEVAVNPEAPDRAAQPAAPAPAATPATTAPDSSRIAALRSAIRAALSGLRGVGAENLNAEWLELKRRIRVGLPDTAQNRELLKLLDKAYAAVRSPKLIEDTMIAVWERAQRDSISTTEALVRMAGEGQQLYVIASGAGVLGFDEFRAVLLGDRPFIDDEFKTDVHGRSTPPRASARCCTR